MQKKASESASGGRTLRRRGDDVVLSAEEKLRLRKAQLEFLERTNFQNDDTADLQVIKDDDSLFVHPHLTPARYQTEAEKALGY